MSIRVRNFLAGDRASILAIAAAADAVDRCERGMSAEELAEWLAEEGFQPQADIFIAEKSGLPVGYVLVFPKGTVLGAVHPEYRRRGVGTQLMQAAELRVARRAQAGGPASLSVFLRSSQQDLVALCESRGFLPGRCLCRMLCDLSDPLPKVESPPGCVIRPYRFGDDVPLLNALNEVFDDDRMTEEQWHQIGIGLPQFWPELWFLAWEGSELAGFCLNKIDPEWIEYSGRQEGELDEVGVRPAWRGRGVAAALVARSLHALRESGMHYAMLNVNAHNEAALHLYRRMGFHEQRRNVTYRKILDLE